MNDKKKYVTKINMDSDYMFENGTVPKADKEKWDEFVRDMAKEMINDKILDTLNEIENKLDDLSQQCCYASYEVEDTVHDLQVSLDKLKETLQ